MSIRDCRSLLLTGKGIFLLEKMDSTRCVAFLVIAPLSSTDSHKLRQLTSTDDASSEKRRDTILDAIGVEECWITLLEVGVVGIIRMVVNIVRSATNFQNQTETPHVFFANHIIC
jgi:hypothetical protein